jgi:polygalacturonase
MHGTDDSKVSRTLTRRTALKTGGLLCGHALFAPLLQAASTRVFNVLHYGAKGDGETLDSPAIQRAIDAAAAVGRGAQVLVPGGKRYLVGTLRLKSDINFHLADDAELRISTRREDYGNVISASPTSDAGVQDAVIVAEGSVGLRISGTGRIDGRAREFMSGYDKEHEWWLPKGWRPKMFVLTECRHLEVRDITFAEAPFWGLHLLGCEDVLVDNVKVRNLLDVPNCDGIDPDHSRRVEIRNCDIVAGDDAIVVKCSRQAKDYGPASHVHVHDCVLETQDAGLKIGTETTSEIHDILFERCHIKTSSRGLGIQLRDEADVYNITFKDIELHSRFYSDPWWGRGEAISFTAIPRKPDAKVGTLHHVTVENISGTAENSVRICGSPQSRVHDVTLQHVAIEFDKATRYAGGVFDNRPTTATDGIQLHSTPGFSIEHADRVLLEDCKVSWGAHRADSFGYAVEAQDVTGLEIKRFIGEPARAELGKGISIS